MSVLHICAPKPVNRELFRCICPDCGKRVFMVSFYYEWYGASVTCLKCGRNYQDGEWTMLGFYREARRDSINIAKTIWRKYDER